MLTLQRSSPIFFSSGSGAGVAPVPPLMELFVYWWCGTSTVTVLLVLPAAFVQVIVIV
jgi:hypothetical protein